MDQEYERLRVAFQDALIAWAEKGADEDEVEMEVRNTFENAEIVSP